MAAAVWPGYARITSSIEISAAQSVARTEFDDGAVRQARRVATPIMRVSIEALIRGDRMPAFRAWAATYAARYFSIPLLDLGTVGMRVVGGVGGIVYEQIGSERAGSIWIARMTLEDAQGAAQGAPFFAAAAAREVVLASKASASDLVLPAALGGAGSVRYSVAPALPEGLVVDAATRRVTGTPAEATVQATHTWTATDAYGRVASTELPFAVAFYAHKSGSEFIVASSGVRLRFPTTTYLPSTWYTPAAHTALDYVGMQATGEAVLSIGVPTPRTDLQPDLLRRLRFRAQLFQRPETRAEWGGPSAPDAQRRDVDGEPYRWVPVAAEAAQITALVAAANADRSRPIDLWIWDGGA